MKKFRSKCGETLAETLVGVLVIALASVALASMITASAKLSTKAKENDDRLYQSISAAETQSGTGTDGTVTVVIGSASVEKAVKFYCADPEEPIYSYSAEGAVVG